MMPAGGGPRPPRGGGGGRPPGAPPAGGGGKYLCPECPVELTSRADMINHLALHAAAAATPAPAVDPDEVEVRRLKRELAKVNGQLRAKGKEPIAISDDLYELEESLAEATENLEQANRPAPNAPAPHTAPHHQPGWKRILKSFNDGIRDVLPDLKGDHEGGH